MSSTSEPALMGSQLPPKVLHLEQGCRFDLHHNITLLPFRSVPQVSSKSSRVLILVPSTKPTSKLSDTPTYLTLGTHVQRGLQYLVCVCVCVSVCLSVCLLALFYHLEQLRVKRDTNVSNVAMASWTFCS